MKIVTVQQMRDLEAGAVARGISLDQLMETAGLRVAEAAARLLGGHPKGEHVTVLVGPGNNGGDGLVAARHLDDWGVRVHIFLCATRPTPDHKLEALRDRVMDIIDLSGGGPASALTRALASSRLVIDAVLGASHSRRAVAGPIQSALEQVQAARRSRQDLVVLALDVPSGLDADTGSCDPATLWADVTVTLGFPKAGMFLLPGAGRVRRIEVAGIGIPEELAAGLDLDLTTEVWAASLLPPRRLDANKGTFGSVLVVAGSARYIGAAALASAGAVRAGAGLVTLAAPRSLVAVVAPMVPEVTYIPLDEVSWGEVRGAEAAKLLHQELPAFRSLLVGCGLGQSPETEALVQGLLLDMPSGLTTGLVIDADGLNILARVPGWWQHVQADAVVTPHPGEMQRLTGRAVADIQANRLQTAREAARAWKKTVLLKGAYSVTATPEGKARINPFANPALASAGTGDVLSGVIAGLMAQGLAAANAAPLGAYLHGVAGEIQRAESGEAGLAASDLLPLIPKAMKQVRGR